MDGTKSIKMGTQNETRNDSGGEGVREGTGLNFAGLTRVHAFKQG